MPAPLSMEVRGRFARRAEDGASGRAAAERLMISASAGIRLARKVRAGEDIAPRPGGRPEGIGKLGPHRAFLLEVARSDGDITMPELAGALEDATGVRVAPAPLGRALRRRGWRVEKVADRHKDPPPRHPAGPAGLGASRASADAGRAAPAGLRRRDVGEDQHDAPSRSGTTRRAPAGRRPVRALAHADLRRRPDLGRADRALGDRGRHGWPRLRHLGRDPARPRAGPRHGRDRGQPLHPQGVRRSRRPPASRMLVPVPSRLRSRPEPDRDGLRPRSRPTSEGSARGPPTTSSPLSATSAQCSAPTNAATISATPAMRQRESPTL